MLKLEVVPDHIYTSGTRAQAQTTRVSQISGGGFPQLGWRREGEVEGDSKLEVNFCKGTLYPSGKREHEGKQFLYKINKFLLYSVIFPLKGLYSPCKRNI